MKIKRQKREKAQRGKSRYIFKNISRFFHVGTAERYNNSTRNSIFWGFFVEAIGGTKYSISMNS